MNMTVARILLYILAGMLLRAGWVDENISEFLRTDEDVQMAVGGLLTLVVIVWWRLAKRFGWKT